MAKATDKKPKVLVVDDEKLIRWTLKEALRGWGYLPLEATDTSGALSLFDVLNSSPDPAVGVNHPAGRKIPLSPLRTFPAFSRKTG